MAALIKVGHNIVVGGNKMAVTLRLKGFNMGGVSVAVVGEHDVMISTVRSDG